MLNLWLNNRVSASLTHSVLLSQSNQNFLVALPISVHSTLEAQNCNRQLHNQVFHKCHKFFNRILSLKNCKQASQPPPTPNSLVQVALSFLQFPSSLQSLKSRQRISQLLRPFKWRHINKKIKWKNSLCRPMQTRKRICITIQKIFDSIYVQMTITRIEIY